MKKRIVFMIGLLLSVFCLAGCGAQVTSDLKFEADGSGSRNVVAVISANDAKNIEGGFEELDLFLEDAAPEGVNLSRTMLENNDAQYQFSFYFEDITEYNEKVSLITGKKHEATWYSSDSIFLSDINFREEQCTKDLIEWALTAFKNSKYAKVSSYFSMYEVGENRVYYEDELMYSGTKDPFFEKEISPSLNKASIYTTYTYEDELHKKIVLEFEPGGLEQMNLELVKQALDVYTREYTIDLGNSTITFDLNKEEVIQFLSKVDKQFKAEDFNFRYKNSAFESQYEILEKYNLNDFFSMFRLEYPYIYDYIHVPEEIEYEKVYHLSQIPDVEAVDNYDYQGAFRYNSEYEMGFIADKKVSVEKVQVDYSLDERLEGERKLTVSFLKNGCDLTKNKLLELYSNFGEAMTVSDNEDKISITFRTKIKIGTTKANATEYLRIAKVKQTNLKEIYYAMSDDIDVLKYLPEIPGFEYDLSNVMLDYQINLDQNTNVYHATVWNQEYDLKKAKNKDTELLGNFLMEGSYRIKGQVPVNDKVQIELKFEKMNPLYYFWLILIVFLFIIAIMIGFFCYWKKVRILDGAEDQEVRSEM